MSSQVPEAMSKQLKNPFDTKFIKWRVGATSQDKKTGIALAYIDSREVTKRFDEVCGIDNWRNRLVPVDGGFISEIDVRIGGEWITRSNAAGYTKVEPIKGGASDAFKRAASTWGVGRYLYYLPNIWVPIKQQGNSYVLAGVPDLPDWATPGVVENWEDVAELEVDASATGDQLDAFEGIITNLDAVRAIGNEADLDALIKTLDKDQELLLANEINIKRRELSHAASIYPDNG